MLRKRITTLPLLLIAAMLFLVACGAAEEVTPTEVPPTATAEMMEEAMAPTIAEVATENGNFTTLLAALTAADLAGTFADANAGPFTVFAPTDDAFAPLVDDGTVAALLEDPSGALTDILTYHVVEGIVDAATVVTLDSATTLNGEEITIEVVDGGVVLNGTVNVTMTDIEASNGIIHVIDAVLLPPSDEMMEEPTQTIAEIATENGNFTTLLAALTAADLAGTFADADAGPFTVFAPTDDAFAPLVDDGTVAALLEDPSGLLTDILTYHVVNGAVDAETVVTLDSADTLYGEPITIEVVDGGVVLNGTVNVIITDIMATNGIIHVIDAVLMPPADEEMMEEPTQTIAEIATENGNFNTLLAALTAADLAGTFADADAGPFTVFAPTDAAFAPLVDDGTVAALLEDPSGALTDILTYHVVEGAVDAATVVTLDSATTLNGKDITIEVVDGGVVLNGTVNVTITDIKATNGIIHVIDAVLLPPADDAMMEEPTQTIAEIATENGNFNTLLAALTAADLAGTFADADAGPFTVFAPTDDAFAPLVDDGTVAALLEDPSGLLTDILTYHVINGAVDAATVVTLDSATTLLGEDITIEVVDGGVVLNGTVNVTITDIKATNGIIHVIDAVLLPPSG